MRIFQRVPFHRPRRRHAPWTLFWGAAIVIVSQLSLGLYSEWNVQIRDPLYGDKAKRLKAEYEKSQPYTVVMLGSSRTGLAFDGLRAEKQMGGDGLAFNFGIPASGPIIHLIYLQRLLKDGITPDLLLLEIMPAMLAEHADAPREKLWFYADRMTHDEMELVINHGFPEERVRERWWKSILFPWSMLRFQLMSKLSPSWLPWTVRFDWSKGSDARGFGTILNQTILEKERGLAIAQAKAEYAPILAGLEIGGPAVDALHEIITLCKERDIALKLVLMPEGSEFRAIYPLSVNQRLNAFLTGLDVDVIDARQWLPDGAFRDSHHMLIPGAAIFTDRLTREVIVPEMEKR